MVSVLAISRLNSCAARRICALVPSISTNRPKSSVSSVISTPPSSHVSARLPVLQRFREAETAQNADHRAGFRHRKFRLAADFHAIPVRSGAFEGEHRVLLVQPPQTQHVPAPLEFTAGGVKERVHLSHGDDVHAAEPP